MARTTRRHFLRVTAISSAGLLLGCERTPLVGVNPEDGGMLLPDGGLPEVDAGLPPPPPDEPQKVMESFAFPLGVASGDVEAERAILWTQFTGTAPLRLRVWKMDQEVYAERVADVIVPPAEGGFTHLDVSGLLPGERYRYAFFEESASGELLSRSSIGRFRAAFAAGTKAPLLLGACSCTSQGRTPTPLLKAGERGDLDLFMFLGDTSYNDNAETRAEYRTRWAANLGSPEYRVLRGATSILATWDDHEVTNDFNPETIEATRFATARASYFESLPLRRDSTNPDRLWKSIRWGDTAEIFVLDSRGERKPSTRFNGQTQQYLSPEQMTWFKAALQASTATFKLIMNSVPITDFGFSAFTGDSWLSYRDQRSEILAHIEDQNIKGVLWVSGDHHFASVGRVSAFGTGRNAIEILAGPGAQSANPAWVGLRPPRWDYATGTNNYVTIALDPATSEATLTFRDGDDQELFSKKYVL